MLVALRAASLVGGGARFSVAASVAAAQNLVNVSGKPTTPKHSFKSKDVVIDRSTQPPPKFNLEELQFGRVFSSHMLEVEWNEETGWGIPMIRPFHHLLLSPAVPAIHYAVQCFEGMKAYADHADPDKIRMFRPMENMARMNRSVTRLCLPSFDGEELVDLIKKLVLIDRHWIPRREGYSLYLRPTVIATDLTIGVHVPQRALLFVITSPAGPYYSKGFRPIKLLASTEFSRAWRGGAGGFKLGSNYAPCIYPQKLAQMDGLDQVLWLYDYDHKITEVGTMNLFFFIINEAGERELVTAPLDDIILPGVTRDTVLRLCRQWNEFKVTERYLNMGELIDLHSKGRVLESFGAGTAAIIAPVEGVKFEDKYMQFPLDPEDPKAGAGPLAKRLTKTILDIQYGRTPSEWSVLIN